MTSSLAARYQGSLPYRIDEFEDGFLDLMTVKDFTVGTGSAVDLYSIAKLQANAKMTVAKSNNCFTLLFGMSVTDNRTVEFVMPPCVASLWRRGLSMLVREAFRHNRRSSDRRMFWLKEQFLQLYFDGSRCHGPTAVEAMKVYKFRLELPDFVILSFHVFVIFVLYNSYGCWPLITLTFN